MEASSLAVALIQKDEFRTFFCVSENCGVSVFDTATPNLWIARIMAPLRSSDVRIDKINFSMLVSDSTGHLRRRKQAERHRFCQIYKGRAGREIMHPAFWRQFKIMDFLRAWIYKPTQAVELIRPRGNINLINTRGIDQMSLITKLTVQFGLVLLLCSALFGQEVNGDIEGTVKDANGAVVPGVVVTVTSMNSSPGVRPDSTAGFTRTITTDSSGFYRMQQIPPGSYTVTTTPTAGFGEARKTNVQVVVGRTTLVDLALAAAGATNVVDVVAGGDTSIDPTGNIVQTNINPQAIDLLPKGVNFTSLLQTAPAVRNEPLSGGFQIDGASGSENTFIIDGQEVSNFRTGTLNINNNIPFQFVQEIQIKSAGFEAEFGGATGGVIGATTKSGGNDFHGEIGTSFRAAKLQAGPRSFQRLVNVAASPGVTALRTIEDIQPRRDEGTAFFPHITLSGPILKDRLWFFVGYAPQFVNIDRTLDYISADPRNRTVTDSQLYTQRLKQEYAFGRLDFQPWDRVRMTASYLWNPLEIIGTPDAFANTTGSAPSITFPGTGLRSGADYLNQVGGRQSSNNTNGSIVWTPTDRLVLTARGGYSFLNEKLGNYGVPAVPGQLRQIIQDFGTPVPAGFGGFGTGGNTFGQNFPGFSQLLFDRSIRRTFDADASYLLTGFLGRHQFKGGYQYNGINNAVESTTVDTIAIRFGRTIAQTSGRPIASTPGAIGSGLLQRFAVTGSAGSDNQAVYIQDSWQPVNRLTLNLGVRAERENSPSFAAGAPGITFGWGDKIAPRLGFAFDVLGDGKNKIFGSYSRFFDRFKYELPRGSFGGNFFRNDYFEIFPGQTLATFTRSAIIGTNPDPIGGNCPLPASTGLSRCQLDFRIPSNLVGNSLDLGAVDPDLEAFQQTEYTIGFERDLGAGTLFSSRYTHKQVDVAVEDIGFISSTGGEAYIIGNPGRGLALQQSQANGFQPLEAVRDYDAAEFRIIKRFATKAYIDASYTYSRLFGNYGGLASSDEAGRTSPNVNRNFDLPFIGFSALGQPDNGRLATDRPHSFKFAGAYSVDWWGSRSNSTEFSGFTIAQSGTPITTRFTLQGVTGQILNGRGDLGRTEMFTQTDLALTHKYRFGRDQRLTLAFDIDVLNAFNEANVLSNFESISALGVNLDGTDVDLGGGVTAIRAFQTQNTSTQINAFLAGRPASDRDPRYGQPTAYQGGRSVRFGFRLLF